MHPPVIALCTGLLHEVRSPNLIPSAVGQFIAPECRLHVNVPNPESFHRVLAQAIGLIVDTKVMSERNDDLQQNRVHDMAALRARIAQNGLRAIAEGGYYVKPFSHSQMMEVLSQLGADVMERLYELGQKPPQSASEIWGEAEVDDGA